jgi:hypothetical protein
MILEKANPITIRLDSILEPARNLPVPDPWFASARVELGTGDAGLRLCPSYQPG